MENCHSLVIRLHHWLLFASFQSMGFWKFYLESTHGARSLSPIVLTWPELTLPKSEMYKCRPVIGHSLFPRICKLACGGNIKFSTVIGYEWSFFFFFPTVMLTSLLRQPKIKESDLFKI